MSIIIKEPVIISMNGIALTKKERKIAREYPTFPIEVEILQKVETEWNSMMAYGYRLLLEEGDLYLMYSKMWGGGTYEHISFPSLQNEPERHRYRVYRQSMDGYRVKISNIKDFFLLENHRSFTGDSKKIVFFRVEI